jgi:hypothetical protein
VNGAVLFLGWNRHFNRTRVTLRDTRSVPVMTLSKNVTLIRWIKTVNQVESEARRRIDVDDVGRWEARRSERPDFFFSDQEDRRAAA